MRLGFFYTMLGAWGLKASELALEQCEGANSPGWAYYWAEHAGGALAVALCTSFPAVLGGAPGRAQDRGGRTGLNEYT